MKKLLGYVTAAALGLFISIPLNGEAKTVAVLPLVNNVAVGEDLESIYYDRSLEAIHQQADLEQIEGKELEDAIAKYTKTGVLPDKMALQNIAVAANVDLVMVGEIDKLEKKSLITTGDHKVKVIIRGAFASYDRQTGKYFPHDVRIDKQEMAVFTSRWDVKTEEWAKVVSRECHRILGTKNLNLEGPRITKLK